MGSIMVLKSDYASIAATSSGVSGTVTTLGIGARIVGLNIAMKTADGGIISSIELISTKWPAPIKLVPTMAMNMVTTNCMALAFAPTPMISLERFGLVANSNTVTIKVTTTANETVVVGLI
jgi:hypothetical protein